MLIFFFNRPLLICTCSNTMGGGVTTHISGYRVFSLRNYITLRSIQSAISSSILSSAPSRYRNRIPDFFDQRRISGKTDILTSATVITYIGRFAMCCATVFCWRKMCSLKGLVTVPARAYPIRGHTQMEFPCLQVTLLDIWCAS